MAIEFDKAELKQWIETSLKNKSNTLAAGYQGKTLLYKKGELLLVIKTPHGWGPVKYLHKRMLRHEARVYQQLQNMEDTAACYGLIDKQYLVLEFILGAPIRNKRPVDKEKYFRSLFNAIEQMHTLGIGHMDLKKKDNLLVTHHDKPCIIDFGAAIIKKRGFHPINHFLYNLAKRFDYNAWIKHKYHNDMRNISEQDQTYYQRTYIEKIAKRIKRFFTF